MVNNLIKSADSDKLKIFISYVSFDKGVAGNMKEELSKYGVDVFVAHDDLDPGVDWNPEIIENIKNADIFIPILSEKYRESMWTDQEIGVAIGNEKYIIPISLDGTLPHGFISKYQAYKNFKYLQESISGKDISTHYSIYKLLEFLCNSSDFKSKEKILNCIIFNLKKVNCFDQSSKLFNLINLLKNQSFSSEQINEICISIITNTQIYCSWNSHEFILNFIKLCKGINVDYKTKILERIKENTNDEKIILLIDTIK